MSDILAKKRCYRCGKYKDIREFYANKSKTDKHQDECKECKKKDDRKYRDKNSQKIRTHQAIYNTTATRKMTRKKANKKYRESNPLKIAAHKKLNHAISDHKIIRQPCCVCGSENSVHGHHDDYTKPFDVIWLCPACHYTHHQTLRDIDMGVK